MTKELLYNNFAVFGVDANESTLGNVNSDDYIRWNTKYAGIADTLNNIDLKNMVNIKRSILNKFDFLIDLPTYGLGISNGANFSDFCGSILGYNASAHITAKGKFAVYNREDVVPIIWVASETDNQEFADNNIALANFENAKSKQPSSEFHWFRKSPLYKERFIRNIRNVSIFKSKKYLML
ncbi:MAG: hypothetical protein V3V14_03920 [Saprospiraceae bacterium]